MGACDWSITYVVVRRDVANSTERLLRHVDESPGVVLALYPFHFLWVPLIYQWKTNKKKQTCAAPRRVMAYDGTWIGAVVVPHHHREVTIVLLLVRW